MKGYKEIKEEYGKWVVLRLLLYPLTTLLRNPFALIKSIANSLVLLKGNWKYYPHFNLLSSVNSTFYWTRALNLSWFGRSGTSPYLGLGNYSLSRCFHYTLFSLKAYWKAGAVTVFIGMFIWLFSNLAWIREVDNTWVFIITGTALISTTFYTNLFRQQNYNVVGWAIYPLFLYFSSTNDWLLAGIVLVGVSFGSFTLVVISGFYAVALSVFFGTFYPILFLLPATLKLALHFYPVFKSGKASSILQNVLKAIGATKGKARYTRKAVSKINMKFLYFLFIYLLLFVCLYLFNGELPILLLIAIGVYLLNSLLTRFADEQTVYLLMLTSAIPELMIRENYYLLIPFWIAASPLPGFIGFDVFKKSIDRVIPLKPFFIKPYFDAFEIFFEQVQEREKVIFAWNDPKDQYEKVFDGYRRIYEVALYVATTLKIHLTPDWWTVFELNYEGAPDFWGRSVKEVKLKLEEWNSKYVIVYQEDNSILDDKWIEADFNIISQFDWGNFTEDFKPYDKIDVDGLNWWLMEYKGDGSN